MKRNSYMKTLITRQIVSLCNEKRQKICQNNFMSVSKESSFTIAWRATCLLKNSRNVSCDIRRRRLLDHELRIRSINRHCLNNKSGRKILIFEKAFSIEDTFWKIHPQHIMRKKFLKDSFMSFLLKNFQRIIKIGYWLLFVI